MSKHTKEGGNGKKEKVRQKALEYYRILDSQSEERFDEIVRLTSIVVGAPIAYISFLDKDRQWFKAIVGYDLSQTGRYYNLTQYVTEKGEVIEINDLLDHPSLKEDPLVQGPPYLRSYIGAPIMDPDGNVIGSICAADTVPRDFHQKDRSLLVQQAEHIVNLLEARLKEKARRELEFDLSKRILDTEERVRNRIGQDIHDGIAQTLTAMNMFYEQIKQEFYPTYGEGQIKSCFDEMDGLLSKAVEEARGVSHDLSLKNLQFGLSSALKDLFSSFDGETHPLRVKFRNINVQGVELNDFQEKNLYRIAQEILNNTLKHSPATRLRFDLYQEGNNIMLITSDNGKGTSSKEADVEASESIMERVEALDGQVQVDDGNENGVAFSISIPIDNDRGGRI